VQGNERGRVRRERKRESKEVKKKGEVDAWTMWSLGRRKRESRGLKIEWAPGQRLFVRAMSVDRKEG
jgi:hypothetical protein